MRQAKATACLVPLAALALLVGCTSQQVTEENLRRPILDGDQAWDLGYSTVWTTDLNLPVRGRIAFASQVNNQIIIVEKGNNLVTALSADDGSIAWRREIGNKLERLFKPFGDGGDEHVYINSDYRLFRISPADGRVTGVSQLQEAVITWPTVAGGKAIFGGTNGLVFGHDLTAGRSTWSYRLSAGVVAPPVAAGNNVLVTSSSGVYAMLSVDRGELQWIRRTFARISALSIMTNQGVWIPSEDATLYAAQRIDGRDRWKYPATKGLTRDPLLHRNTIFLSVPDRGLVAINALRGQEIWEQPELEALPEAVTPHGLLLNDHTKLIFADTVTGRILKEAPTLWVQDVITGPNDSLFLVSPYGKIQRISLRR